MRSRVKIRSIYPGSAVKYGTLCSFVCALLTGVPLALIVISVARQIISLLSPIINLLHGSVAGATASATSTTLLLLLVYVVAIMLFGCIFTLLVTLAYNLLARLTGGLTLDVENVRQAAQMGVPQGVRQAEKAATVEAEAPEAKEIAPSQEPRQAAGTVPLKEVSGTREIVPSQEDAKAEGKPALKTEGPA